MKIDEVLRELEVDFREWRQTKRARNVAIPDDLLARARAAAAKYGANPVARLLHVERKRIKPEATDDGTSAITETPSFSRIQVAFPRGPQPSQLLMEAETPVGVKLRIFAMTPETISALSSFCRVGGAP